MTIKNYFRLMAEGRHKGPAVLIWKPILKIASLVYALITGIRHAFYRIGILRPKRLPIPVVSIGNISWGGVGKTPLTLFLTRFLIHEKKVPLVLTRGYGSDESREYATDVPEAVLGVGKSRSQVANNLLKSRKIDIAILDDGYQHQQLKRDLDIVVINALNPFGNRSLIPSGILREWPPALELANLIVFNDVNLIPRKSFEAIRDEVKKFAPKAEIVEAMREPLYFYRAKSKDKIDLAKLRGKRVTTFSGVGTPRSFQLLMNNLGVKTARNFEFGDHHPFTDKELKEIQEVRELSNSEYVVTTEKDFLRKEEKITQILDPLILKTTLRITIGEMVLKERIRKLLTNHQGVHV